MQFIAATIGRNVGNEPMHSIKWEQFKSELRAVMKEHAMREWEFTQVFTGVGEWDGISEENYRFEMYFLTGEFPYDMLALEDILQTLGRLYQQDGIALLTGNSIVV